MNYSATGEQLTAIAEAIRDKQCKNKWPPDAESIRLLPDTKYAVSMTILWDGIADQAFTAIISSPSGTQLNEVGSMTYIPPMNPQSGETTREEIFPYITTQDDYPYYVLTLNVTSGLTASKIQVEKGEEATSYAPYVETTPLAFPDGFISAIEGL